MLDPHAWLDPANGQAWLAEIAAQLGRIDPENAGIYRLNATEGQDIIARLDAELATELAGAAGRPFVTFHDAYGYFTDHYGLEPAIAISGSDAASPSAARLREVRQRISDSGAVCAFPEANQSPRTVEELTRETGLRIGDALSPEGSGLTPGAALYPDLLRSMATRILACLNGPAE